MPILYCFRAQEYCVEILLILADVAELWGTYLTQWSDEIPPPPPFWSSPLYKDLPTPLFFANFCAIFFSSNYTQKCNFKLHIHTVYMIFIQILFIKYDYECNWCPPQAKIFIFHSAKRKNYKFLGNPPFSANPPFLPSPPFTRKFFNPPPLFGHFENRQPPLK